jgi:hypothetical protein
MLAAMHSGGQRSFVAHVEGALLVSVCIISASAEESKSTLVPEGTGYTTLLNVVH